MRLRDLLLLDRKDRGLDYISSVAILYIEQRKDEQWQGLHLLCRNQEDLCHLSPVERLNSLNNFLEVRFQVLWEKPKNPLQGAEPLVPVYGMGQLAGNEEHPKPHSL